MHYDIKCLLIFPLKDLIGQLGISFCLIDVVSSKPPLFLMTATAANYLQASRIKLTFNDS